MMVYRMSTILTICKITLDSCLFILYLDSEHGKRVNNRKKDILF
jgi:hypothetical protein